ncbi:MAG: GNAT family N-acetyltransferase, partial [Chitinophagaceae bacterium]
FGCKLVLDYRDPGVFGYQLTTYGWEISSKALTSYNEENFEFAKLFVSPKARNLGIATKLIERCITRCHENGVKKLWMQTTIDKTETHRLYHKLGFMDQNAPTSMKMLRRTERIMAHDLEG